MHNEYDDDTIQVSLGYHIIMYETNHCLVLFLRFLEEYHTYKIRHVAC